MCGIAGIVTRNPSEALRPAAESMALAMKHRGPDSQGVQDLGSCLLASARLSIIDLSDRGRMPMSSPDGRIWITYNGETYNAAELRSDLERRGHSFRTTSDTEVVLHLYQEFGERFVEKLRGMFAFAIWDRRKRVLFAARDRLGIKPFYYRWDGKSFLFGSEIKTILTYPGVDAEFDRGRLAEYLTFGYITGPQTMYAGIRKLMPGHNLELSEGREPKITRYWDLVVPVDELPREHSYYVKNYREKFESAVRSHLMSDVPLGVFLSGGLDSSAVAALAAKIRGDKIQTFAVGYGEEEFSELPYARQVAAHIHSDHHEVRLSREEFFDSLPRLIWHEDEPIVWPSSVSLYYVARLARERVTVVLTGEGSDETLAGYTRYAWTLLNSKMDRTYRAMTPAFLRRWLRQGIASAPLSASLHRKLEHTFLMRDGASWPSFYFDNFYSAFSDAEFAQLLTPEALQSAGHAYDGSMEPWELSLIHI